MPYYYNTKTKEYPRHDGDLELLGWKVGEPLPNDWVQVLETESPSVLETELAYEILPKLIDGVWTRQWATKTLTREEQERLNQETFVWEETPSE